METRTFSIAFGPIPSRRLGQSLGINNIPAKTCSYSCIYCQVGWTTEKRIQPRAFYPPEQLHDAIAAHIAKLRRDGQRIDYLSFVPDGEPTLDLNLAASIERLRGFGIPIAVFTNASLLWRDDVRAQLSEADLISVKVDSVDEATWKEINRPHPDLGLDALLGGVRRLAAEYAGTLISETMLLDGVNDSDVSLTTIADFLAAIAPQTAYLAVPTRPTALGGVKAAAAERLVRAHELFSARLASVKLLTGHETGTFAHTGDARKDLLAITAVHPMREPAVRRLLAEDGSDWSTVRKLLDTGELRTVDYGGERFYLRPVVTPSSPGGTATLSA